VIEPGALFEGTCKMMKMVNAASGKTKSNGRDVQPLDAVAARDKAIHSDVVDEKSPGISSVSAVAS